MAYKLLTTKDFDKEFKRLSKKYFSLVDDLAELGSKVKINPIQGAPLGNNFYKLRMTIASKGKGKSGGARVIIYVKIINNTVYFASIYDKSEKSTISKAELNEILKLIS